MGFESYKPNSIENTVPMESVEKTDSEEKILDTLHEIKYGIPELIDLIGSGEKYRTLFETVVLLNISRRRGSIIKTWPDAVLLGSEVDTFQTLKNRIQSDGINVLNEFTDFSYNGENIYFDIIQLNTTIASISPDKENLQKIVYGSDWRKEVQALLLEKNNIQN